MRSLDRTRSTRLISTSVAVLCCALSYSGSASAKESSKLKVSLQSTGADADAAGTLRYKGKSNGHRFDVKVKNVDPSSEVVLRVNGIDRLSLPSSKSGKAKFSFKSPARGRSVPLSFDPRGEQVEVVLAGQTVLQVILAPGSNDGKVSERAGLSSTGAIPGASGEVRLVEKRGVTDFDVEIEDLPDGTYRLCVDGIDRGEIVVSGGEGKIEFSDGGDDPDELPLDFDAYAALVEVKQGETVVLSGLALSGSAEGGGNSCAEEELRLDFENVGPDADAKGEARHRVRDDCDRDFRVEIEDLPDGLYDLFVGGVDRGDIEVTEVLGEHVGEIEFDTDPNEVGKELLIFDPRGQLLQVKQGETVFLSLGF